MTLGEKLYILRTRQGMTQEQLAEKLQVSRQSISKWESDATRPDFDKLKFLAEFYHISLDELVFGPKKSQVPPNGKDSL